MSSDFLSKDVVYVSSANRSSGTSGQFTINLSSSISPNNDYDTVTLLSFYCPKSYYLIQAGYNKFQVQETGAPVTITIPVGNYSFNTFAIAVISAFQTAGLSYTYTCQALTILGKFIFTVVAPATITLQPKFIFADATMAIIMGFLLGVNTFAAGTITSTNLVNFQKTNTIQLTADFVRKSILSVIIPDIEDFSSISYNEVNANLASHPIISNEFSSATFTLLDGLTGTQLDLNGLDYNFTFAIYKKNNYYQHQMEDRATELRLAELERELNLADLELKNFGVTRQ